MPYAQQTVKSFSYVIEADFVRFTMGERVTADIIEDACRRLLGDPGYGRPMNLLIDDRRNKIPSVPTDVRQAAMVMARYRDRLGRKFAILVESVVQYGMIRMFGTLVQGFGIEVRPFRDEAAAIAWLGSTAPREMA